MNIYWVERTNTTNIAGPYEEGATYEYPDGSSGPARQDAARDLYLERNDRTPAPQPRDYYITTDVLAFVGTVGSNDARVSVTSDHQPRSTQFVLDDQLLALQGAYQSVLDQGVTVTLGGSRGTHDCRSVQTARNTYNSSGASTFPGVTTTSDVDVWGVWFRWALEDLPAIGTQLYLLDAGANGVNENHDDQLNTIASQVVTPGDEKWIELANYDVTVGWPAPPRNNGEVSNTATTQTVPLGVLQYVHDLSQTPDREKDPARIIVWLRQNRDRFDEPNELRARWLAHIGR